MGLDAIVVLELETMPDEKFMNRANNYFIEYVDFVCSMGDGNCFYDITKIDDKYSIKVWSSGRYYGEGYERGNCLEIISAIRVLKKYFKDYGITVYYGHDCGDWEEMDEKEIEKLEDYFVKHGNEPYYRETCWNK